MSYISEFLLDFIINLFTNHWKVALGVVVLISYIGLTLDYAYAGRMEEARAAANEVLRIKPTFSADHWGKVMPNKDPAVTRKNVEALKKAGLK